MIINKTQSPVSLIVDVRSAEQFSIARLNLPHVLTFASLEESAVLEASTAAQRVEMLKGVRAVQVNVPLSVLKGGRAASARDTNQQQVLSGLHRLRLLLCAPQQNSSEPTSSDSASGTIFDTTSDRKDLKTAPAGVEKVGMYVLCRRGIDSVTATQLLLSLDVGPSVWNVEGGLTAWSRDVDSDFLMY